MATGSDNLSKLIVQFIDNVNNRLESLEKKVENIEHGNNTIQKAPHIRDSNGNIVRAARESQEHVLQVIERASDDLNGDTNTEPSARPKKTTSDARKKSGQCNKHAQTVVSVRRPALRGRYFCAHTTSELRALEPEMYNTLIFLPEEYAPPPALSEPEATNQPRM